MKKENLFIIFAKNPENQPVKTRLAKKIGNEARKVYEKMLLQSINTHKAAFYEFKLYVIGDKDYFLNYLAEDRIEEQAGETLGDRMFNAFATELNDYKKVIISGSDILLSKTFVEEAFRFTDCVIGPSLDGGYYIIGLSKLQNLFFDIPWSTSIVFEKTKQLILQLKLKALFLEKKRDLDDYEDYVYYKKEGLL